MKAKILIMTLSLALVSFATQAQDSNTHVTFNHVEANIEANICTVLNMMQQGNGDIVTQILMAHSDNPNGGDAHIIGTYVLKMSPYTLQVTDSLFLPDSVPPTYLYAKDPRGEGNIRANIEPDGEGNTLLRISHFTDDDLNVIGSDDAVVPLCEGEAFEYLRSSIIDCQGNLILKYYKETSPGVNEGHIARYTLDGTLLYDTLIPSNLNFINTMEVFKESPLEYCQWRKGGNGNLNFYVLDSTFQLKNTYIINKSIQSTTQYTEYFEFYSSNSNSTFVVPDGEDVLVAAYYIRDELSAPSDWGVAAARYDLHTLQRKALAQFNDYPGPGLAKCFGFQKMHDGTIYLLYREEGMPIKYWMTVVKMDSDLNVMWKRYCETPNELMDVYPYGTEVSIKLEDNEGDVEGIACAEYMEGVIHLFLNHDGITEVAEGGIKVRPYAYYPNPAQDQLHLQYSPDVHPTMIELYDMQGRLVRSQDNAFETLDIGTLSAGTYTMHVTMDDGKTFSDKLVKE